MSLLEDKDTAAKMEKDEITSTVSSDRNEQRRTIEKKSTSLFNQKLALKIDLHVLLPMIFLNFLSLSKWTLMSLFESQPGCQQRNVRSMLCLRRKCSSADSISPETVYRPSALLSIHIHKDYLLTLQCCSGTNKYWSSFDSRTS